MQPPIQMHHLEDVAIVGIFGTLAMLVGRRGHRLGAENALTARAAARAKQVAPRPREGPPRPRSCRGCV